ncbi:MAG: hypothetical protein M3Y21_11635 [Candidatus Eremiobacteraeota bacterium]|nr:hypothetical protein [Candidatus Eremiobacteraeota bacterium]
MSGLLILLVFAVFAVLMYRRIVPALLAVPLMAVVMAAVAGVPLAGIGSIVILGSSFLASVFIAVIFGAMLGRVTIETGIARSIVNFAAEFGGENPMVLALVLCAVVAILFVSLNGLGAIIMVGSIVLPIMMTVGVPRKVAANLFLMSFALGFIFNITNWKFYTKFFGVAQQQMYEYAIVLAVVDLLALLVYAAIAFRTTRDYATWAVAGEAPATRRVPWWSLITPLLPIGLYFGLAMDPIIAFPLSAIYGVLTTQPSKAIKILVASAIRGFEDVAPAVLLFIGIGMLVVASKQPQFIAALHPLIAGDALRSPVLYIVVFGLLSPLVLYRGPLNPFGVGIAIFTALLAAHVFAPVILVAAIMAVVQVQNVCDPTNTANVWIANFTGVQIDEITKRTLPYQVAVATIACVIVAFGSPVLFGLHPFRALGLPAAAAEAYPGMLASEPAAFRIAVGNDGSATAKQAADAVVAALNGSWHGVNAFNSTGDPNVDDCSHKSYAAFLNVNATSFAIEAGTDVDIGLQLADCGGWGVDEWHDHAVFAQIPRREDVQKLALEGLFWMRAWSVDHPARASNLLEEGLAHDPHDPPTYYYSLFKTVDGNMRTFVRAGGPAYAAGMRTNDIVNKLDGKFWWMYGTYQTQLRAYDGKPHTFELQRGSQTIEVALGAPFY